MPLDIDLLYALRLAKHFAHAEVGFAIALATLALCGIATYIALATLVRGARDAISIETSSPTGQSHLYAPPT